jgi:ABC-type uncharacterized transport system fused permease/ATPase subunit
MLFAIPSSAVNSGMEYFTKKLALAFRERLTTHFHDKYLQKMFYYKVLMVVNPLDLQLRQQNSEP